MKTKLFLGSFMAISLYGAAQNNSFPTPSGITIVNGSPVITNPTNRLEVYGTGANNIGVGGTAPVINFYGGATVPPLTPVTAYAGPYAKLALATGAGGFVGTASAGDLVIQNMGMSSPITGNGKSIVFSTRFQSGNGIEHMRINELGNVGIGVLAPVAKLEVNRDLTPPGSYAMHRGIKSNIQGVAPIVGGGGPSYGIVGVEGNSTGYSNQGQTYGVIGTGSYGTFNIGGLFQGTGAYGCSLGDEVFGVRAIATGGQQNYGIYAESNGFNPACTNNYAGYFVGNVLRTGWDNFTSDRKLKKDIVPLENALENLMKLKPSSYQFRTDEFKTLNLPQGAQMGLIAQDLEQVFPELVTDVAANYEMDKEGNKVEHAPEFKAVRYINLIPVLIAGIQEQQHSITDLKAINEKQQKQLDEQQRLIESLSEKLSGTTGIGTIKPETGFQMSQNEPNPFTRETVVKYTLPKTINNAFMAVYDLTGKQITTFPIRETGSSSLVITSEKLAAGIYIYSIVADGKVMDSKRMIVSE